MARTKEKQAKRSFSTRISPLTLDRLDGLVQSGQYPNRTAAIEAAVDRLVADNQDRIARWQKAFAATSGVLSLGITPESMREDEIERLEWEAERARGG